MPTNPIPPPATENHKITKARAVQLIAKYSVARVGNRTPHLLVRGGTFNKAQLRSIITNNDVAGIRYYFAIVRAGDVPGAAGDPIGSDDEVPTIVIVGVDANGNDILTPDTDGTLKLAAESSWPCPPHCGAVNELNTA